jgi:hypothetical protein
MLSSLSFANVDPWVSNTPGTNSPIGELTTYGKTFTRELGIYQDVARPNYSFNCLKSIDETNGVVTKVVLSSPLVVKMARLTEWLYNKVISVSGQIYHDTLLAELVPWAATNLNLTNLTLGPVRSQANVNGNTVWMADWVAFTDASSAGSSHKIWFAIQSLYDEYPDYDIVVVPPLANSDGTPALDLFFTTGANVETLVKAITQPQRDDAIQLAKSNNPETILRSDNYDYVNPLNSTHRVSVNWPVLIYGPAGNNVDAIKDAMIEYILANSTHTREEWTVRFPDIFKRTEFIIAPSWHKYAVENLTLSGGGVYSPILKTGDALTLMKTIASEYDETHVDAHTSIMGHPYRSLALVIAGGLDNRNVLFDIEQVFPDYISVSSQSADFSRMSPDTQGFVLMLQDLLVVAEELDAASTLPRGTMRVVRDGRMFAVKTYQNIQYLVASKKTTHDLMIEE